MEVSRLMLSVLMALANCIDLRKCVLFDGNNLNYDLIHEKIPMNSLIIDLHCFAGKLTASIVGLFSENTYECC